MTRRDPRNPRAARQGGLTLVELMVTVLLMGIVGAITTAAFISGSNTLGRVDDDVRGQGDQRVLAERLSRDLRAARGVDVSLSDDSQLVIWIDSDADYVQAPAETITWALATTASADGHYDVRRTTGAGGTAIVGRALVSNIAFAYNRPVAIDTSLATPGTGPLPTVQTSLVSVTMEYDAIVNAYLQKKKTIYQIRLRNTR